MRSLESHSRWKRSNTQQPDWKSRVLTCLNRSSLSCQRCSGYSANNNAATRARLEVDARPGGLRLSDSRSGIMEMSGVVPRQPIRPPPSSLLLPEQLVPLFSMAWTRGGTPASVWRGSGTGLSCCRRPTGVRDLRLFHDNRYMKPAAPRTHTPPAPPSFQLSLRYVEAFLIL